MSNYIKNKKCDCGCGEIIEGVQHKDSLCFKTLDCLNKKIKSII